MANSITPVDVHVVVNNAAQAMFGADTTLQAADTSSFVTVGEAMLRAGYENTLNALHIAMARTIIAVRPYRGKFNLIDAQWDAFGEIIRKISYFYNGFKQSQDWNTQLAPEQLKDGNSIDHYKIMKRYPLEVNFAGNKVLEKGYTTFRKQLRVAFQNEEEFARFYAGRAVQIANELETMREIENRMHVLNHIGAVYNTGSASMKINLTAGFNAKYGTNYTSEQLRREHLRDFLGYFVSTLKYHILLMEENNILYHLTPVKTDDAGNPLQLLRHTPRSMQRLLLYSPLILDAEAMVFPEIFNDNYLKLNDYEPVAYWQNPNKPSAVSVTPNQLNVTTGQSETGEAVEIPYVVGVLFDRDAMATCYRAQDTLTTPINAAGDYYNTFLHWAKDYQQDFTENSILFYMADEAGGASVEAERSSKK